MFWIITYGHQDKLHVRMESNIPQEYQQTYHHPLFPQKYTNPSSSSEAYTSPHIFGRMVWPKSNTVWLLRSYVL